MNSRPVGEMMTIFNDLWLRRTDSHGIGLAIAEPYPKEIGFEFERPFREVDHPCLVSSKAFQELVALGCHVLCGDDGEVPDVGVAHCTIPATTQRKQMISGDRVIISVCLSHTVEIGLSCETSHHLS